MASFLNFCIFFLAFLDVSLGIDAEDILNLAFQVNDVSPTIRRHLLDDEDALELGQATQLLGQASGLLASVLADELGSGSPRRIADSPRSNQESNPLSSAASILKTLGARLKSRGKDEEGDHPEPMERRPSGLQGQHVCVKEVGIAEKISESHDRDSEMCDLYREASVCVLKSPMGKVTKRIQHCCDGYTTTNIDEFGCLTEISDELLFGYNVSRSDAPPNSTLLFTKLNDASFILPGIQNSYDWTDKQILETAEKQKFMVSRTTEDQITEVYLNCALKKETIRLEASQILKFDGVLKPAADNLLEIIEKTPELSTFNKVLGEELRTFLREINSATVFAFTNEAFEKLPEATKKQIVQADGNDCVQEIMKHHITTSGSYCSNLPRHIESLNGENLTCRRNGTTLHVDEAQVIDSSGFALNGVVHIIDTVLVRENFLSWRDTLKLFNAKMVDELERTNLALPVTIFVPPTDKNTTEIGDVRNYVVSGKLIADFKDMRSIQTDANSTIFTASLADDRSQLFSLRAASSSPFKNIRLGCSKFTAASIQSCKAVIHFLDKPLPLVTSNVEQFIETRKDLSMFAKIWKKANFTIKAEDKVTVFAPVDDAFSANEVKKIMRTEKSAMEFVKRHVVRSILCESDVKKSGKKVVRSTMYTSLGGQLLTPFTDDDGNVEVNGARIEEIELVQSNGVVHILESFIEPPSLEKKISPQQIIRNPLNIFSHIFG